MKRCATASAAIVFTLIFILSFMQVKAVGIICLCFAVFLVVAALLKNKALIFTAAFCLAASLSVFLFFRFGVAHDYAYNGMDLKINATVESALYDGRYILKINEAGIGTQTVDINGKVILNGDIDDVLEERDIISGTFSMTAPSKSGSLLVYEYANGAYLNAYLKSDYKYEGFKEPTVFDVSYNLRQYIQNVTSKIGGDAGGLVLSLLTGNKSDMTEKTVTAFRDCGLSHIMAVSGMHLSVVTAIGVTVIDKFELERKLRQILCLILIVFVMTAAAFSYSVMRAGIMSVIVILAAFFNRRSDGLNSLGVSVTAICLINPFAVMDIGFILSVSATFGILVIMPLLYRFIYKIRLAPLRWVVSCLLVSLSATIGILPACAFIFSSVSFIGLMLSVLTNIFVALLIVLGLILCAFHFVPGISSVIIYLTGLFADTFIIIAKYCSRFKFAVMEFEPLPLMLFFVLIFLFGLIKFIPIKEKPRKNVLLVLGSITFLIAVLCSAKPVFSQCYFNVSGENNSLGVYARAEDCLVVLDCTDAQRASEIKDVLEKNEKIDLYFVPEYSDSRMEVLKNLASLNKIEKLVIADIDDKQKYDIIELFENKNTKVILAQGGCSFECNGVTVSLYSNGETGFIPYISCNGFGAVYLPKTADPNAVSYLPEADMLVMNGKYLSSVKGIFSISPKNVTVYNASYRKISSFNFEYKEKDFSLNEVTGKVYAAIEKNGKFTVYGEV